MSDKLMELLDTRWYVRLLGQALGLAFGWIWASFIFYLDWPRIPMYMLWIEHRTVAPWVHPLTPVDSLRAAMYGSADAATGALALSVMMWVAVEMAGRAIRWWNGSANSPSPRVSPWSRMRGIPNLSKPSDTP